jgi:FMN phosphatase YigB (HAD superfamily)
MTNLFTLTLPLSLTVAVSFDLFDTLVSVPRPEDTPGAIAAELDARDVPVPADWEAAGREAAAAIDAAEGEEVSITTYAARALASRDVHPERKVIESAVLAAFDRPVATRDGALEAVAAAGARGSVGVLSNCSVSGLVERTLERSAIDTQRFDAVVSSVDLGWRKPHERAFRAIVSDLGVSVADLTHVGDDPHDDGGASDVGATAVLLGDVPLAEFPTYLEARGV